MHLGPTILIFIALCYVLFGASGHAQNRCVELVGYEFFVPKNSPEIQWPESEIRSLVVREADNPTRFLLPGILVQLRGYQPACGTSPVDSRFDLLLTLYSVIRDKEWTASERNSVDNKLKFVRDDFLLQIKDDRLFSGLIYTMDDGPLTGKIVSSREVKPTSSKDRVTPFGKLTFANTDSGVFVTAFDKTGRALWARMLRGTNPERDLKKAQLESLSIEQTDFVVVAYVFVDGERLSLYTRRNGRFMYYNHSW